MFSGVGKQLQVCAGELNIVLARVLLRFLRWTVLIVLDPHSRALGTCSYVVFHAPASHQGTFFAAAPRVPKASLGPVQV